MKRALLEQGLVVVLFVLVLIVFSFAERDSKKLVDLYNRKTAAKPLLNKGGTYTAEISQHPAEPAKTARN